jgi:N-acetylneuraminic acid mutarotase
LHWNTTKNVLPETVYDSHLAIVEDEYDGYSMYLFGGRFSSTSATGSQPTITDRIYGANLADPMDWKVIPYTEGSLPTPLCGAQLAIVNNRIYLFGGNNGAATDTIFSAPVSNPLQWTNHGSLLPKKLYDSQLAIIGSNIYLFGGRETDHVSDVIFNAPISNPLDWYDTGRSITDPVYGSQLAIIKDTSPDGYGIYLFGGVLSDGSVTNNIYHAGILDPTGWDSAPVATLPYPAAHGQFVMVNGYGYLYTNIDNQKNETRILRCNLNAPTVFTMMQRTIPGVVTQSQLGIVSDRLYLFGGNGSSIIFASNVVLKYNYYNTFAANYGFKTRTVVNNTPNKLDLFKVIGFAPWRTDYGT